MRSVRRLVVAIGLAVVGSPWGTLGGGGHGPLAALGGPTTQKAVYASPTTRPGALVPNGDFEQGMEGWSPVKPAGFANGELGLVTGDTHGGKNAIRILNPPGEKVLTGAITGFLPLPAEVRTFEIRLWMKSAVAAQTMELRLAAMDPKGQVLAPADKHGWVFIRPPVGDSVGRWTEFSAMFLAQPDWGGVQLTVWVNGAGADVRFDDIRIQPVDTSRHTREIAATGGRLPDPTPGVAPVDRRPAA